MKFRKVYRYKTNKQFLEGRIKNLQSLPGGLRCNFLLCLIGENGDLIAQQWKRKRPTVNTGQVLITF